MWRRAATKRRIRRQPGRGGARLGAIRWSSSPHLCDEGMKGLLTQVLRCAAGLDGEPVIHRDSIRRRKDLQHAGAVPSAAKSYDRENPAAGAGARGGGRILIPRFMSRCWWAQNLISQTKAGSYTGNDQHAVGRNGGAVGRLRRQPEAADYVGKRQAGHFPSEALRNLMDACTCSPHRRAGGLCRKPHNVDGLPAGSFDNLITSCRS